MACRTGCQEQHDCSECRESKPCGDFYRRASGRRAGMRLSECRPCMSRRRTKNRQARPQQNSDYMRLWRYGLSPEAFKALLNAQGNKCAICLTPEPKGKGGWHIDHDHACCPEQRSCGKCVRGLLCHHCNSGIGLFRENPENLRRAAQYVEL